MSDADDLLAALEAMGPAPLPDAMVRSDPLTGDVIVQRRGRSPRRLSAAALEASPDPVSDIEAAVAGMDAAAARAQDAARVSSAAEADALFGRGSVLAGVAQDAMRGGREVFVRGRVVTAAELNPTDPAWFGGEVRQLNPETGQWETCPPSTPSPKHGASASPNSERGWLRSSPSPTRTSRDDSSPPRLTPYHRLIQGRLRVADLSSHVALRAPELAVRLRVSRATAYRMLERLAGSQHREEALRIGTTVAPIGSGAKRKVLAVLWPVEAPP